MEPYELLLSLALALGVGLLLGFEREQSIAGRKSRHPFLGGARTYPLVSMLGAVSTLVSRRFGSAILILPLVGLVSLLAVGYWDDVRRDRSRGITSEMAFLLAYALGALAITPDVIEPVGRRAVIVGSVAVAATGLLSLRTELQEFATRLSRQDVFATLKFLFVAVILLPQLPTEPVGPGGVIVPRNIGLVVVLIVGLSFAGYVAVRRMGPSKGISLTGLFGGLVSSTAVTVSMARNVHRDENIGYACAGAVQLASAVTFVRILIEVWIVNRALLWKLTAPIVAMMVATLVVAFIQTRRAHRYVVMGEEVHFQNPVELSSAFKMAAIFTIVLLASQLATQRFGVGATYLTGFLAGTTNVDAITISMAKLAKENVPEDLAVATILIGAASNALVKSILAYVFGGRAFGRHVLLPSAGIFSIGAAVWLALRLS